jgi:predicted alpha-1,2-mannosidase
MPTMNHNMLNVKKRLLLSVALYGCLLLPITGQTLTEYVNPFIGTGGHGHTFPGATAPFGMVQVSPDTRLTGWDGCSGYHYTDSIIYGFSHTHLSGTGVSDYGDILLMPGVGLPLLRDYAYKSRFRKENESASPGYYRVLLDDPGITAELTCSKRAAMHRYTFPNVPKVFIALDLVHRDPVLDASIDFISETAIAGHRRSRAWAEDQVVYFYMEFSQPFHECGTFSEGGWKGGGFNYIEHPDLRSYFSFMLKKDEPLLVRIGISAVDIEGAKNNLRQEIPHWNFDLVKDDTQKEWERELSKILVEDPRDSLKTIFYSALYHTMIHPNVFSDVDGRYRGIDKNIHSQYDHEQYTVFSLWDTYRALHPLYNLIQPKKNNAFIRSMLNMYRHGGLLPVWELAGNETFCMIGYHSTSVIADAWMKGIRDYSSAYALEAMMHSASLDHFGLDAYRKYAHIPGDKEHESVSKNLEYAYNDWCIAQMALETGRLEEFKTYSQRAQYYKNLYDPETGCMRPRINGAWKEPFHPEEVDFHFTEANSWQYSFYAPQDIRGLIRLHGTEEQFEKQLDALFTSQVPLKGRHQVDITGLIGQYAHGNEPSHHMAYLYTYVGKPWKTQSLVRKILLEQYSAQPDGLSGNEDCGQMSAWYVVSALGFYPVCPGSTQYAVGAPLFDQATIHFENGNTLDIVAKEQSGNNKYVQSIQWNQKPYENSYFEHAALMAGGTIEFIMGPNPNPAFGFHPKNRPVSEIREEPMVIVPYFSQSAKSFTDSMTLEIHSPVSGYSTEFRLGEGEWTPYNGPIRVREKTRVQARNVDAAGKKSAVIEAEYIPVRSLWRVQLKSEYNNQYTAGGPQGLVDGIRGEKNWRLGGWQGYQGQDFETVIDLGRMETIKSIGAGFCQDIRSWIWLPSEVSYYTSTDGKNFKLAGKVGHPVADDDYELMVKDLELKTNTKARYIKVVARNYGTIPAWHLGSGGEAFIFVDEIWIN